jgi:hypothetical protein
MLVDPVYNGTWPSSMQYMLEKQGVQLSLAQIARHQQYHRSTLTAAMSWKEFGYSHRYEEGMAAPYVVGTFVNGLHKVMVFSSVALRGIIMDVIKDASENGDFVVGVIDGNHKHMEGHTLLHVGLIDPDHVGYTVGLGIITGDEGAAETDICLRILANFMDEADNGLSHPPTLTPQTD